MMCVLKSILRPWHARGGMSTTFYLRTNPLKKWSSRLFVGLSLVVCLVVGKLTQHCTKLHFDNIMSGGNLNCNHLSSQHQHTSIRQYNYILTFYTFFNQTYHRYVLTILLVLLLVKRNAQSCSSLYQHTFECWWYIHT